MSKIFYFKDDFQLSKLRYDAKQSQETANFHKTEKMFSCANFLAVELSICHEYLRLANVL